MDFLGIDIGGTRIKAGLVDDLGNVRRQLAESTPAGLAPFRQAFADLLRRATGDSPLGAAGVACKGIIESDTRVAVIPGVFRFLEGQDLGALVREALGSDLPVYADNDARVALVGEMAWGAARGKRNAVMLTLGTGVGGAALVEGRLLRGRSGVAGHFGHITIDPGGPLCNCGNTGCLETFFSALAIEAEAIASVHRSSESRLTEEFSGGEDRLHCSDVFRLAEEGDEAARSIRDRAIGRLAAAVVGLVHAFDPEVVILGGQISRAGSILLGALSDAVATRTRRLAGGRTPVVLSQLEDPSGIVGAAALARLHVGGAVD
jgi:glucokinase